LNKKNALVLIGSPKGLETSTSARLARAVLAPFDDQGWTVDWIHLHRAVETAEGTTELVTKVSGADQVVFAAPLYVDSLPAPAIRGLERIAAARSERTGEEKVPRFAVLINCGFVESQQNDTAVGICRAFAEAAGLEWFGELTMGSAGNGPKRFHRALAEAGSALSSGFPIPPSARKLTRRPAMPKLLYVIGGNVMWRRIAKKRFGVTKQEILAQPCKEA